MWSGFGGMEDEVLRRWDAGSLNFIGRSKILCMQGSGVCALCCRRVLKSI